MPSPRQILTSALLAGACAAVAPTAAGAATLSGTVVGRPTTAGKSVLVPVLLSSSGEQAAGTALAKVVVPKATGLRTTSARIKPGDLRIGDRVSASVGKVTARPRASRLTVTRRATTPSFTKIDKQKATVTGEVTRAIGTTKQILANPTSVLNPSDPASSNSELREQLRAVRTDLNFTIADLRSTATSFDTTVATIVAARPKDAVRRAVAEQREKKVLDGLTADATAGRAAAKSLDDAVAQLDETMNDIGEPSATPIGVEGVTAVSSILYAVLDLLRG